ncbi:MAG: CBS domain-containing protein [Candidatus Heimdallarchaeota archaeon]|nr:CBS domain-containing protein [Candidatus Heimdallarchaeota archaeon]
MSFNINQLFQEVKKMKAIDFPQRKITPIPEETPLLEIINQLGSSDLPIIPVINKKGRYIGIITLQDLLFLFQRKHTAIHEAFSLQHMTEGYIAGELINLHLPIIYDDDSLERIAESMSKFQSSVLPRASARKEQICGLIYLKDIFTEFRNIVRRLIAEKEEPCE